MYDVTSFSYICEPSGETSELGRAGNKAKIESERRAPALRNTYN